MRKSRVNFVYLKLTRDFLILQRKIFETPCFPTYKKCLRVDYSSRKKYFSNRSIFHETYGYNVPETRNDVITSTKAAALEFC